MLDPKVHLVDATPGKLARALLRNKLVPHGGRKPVFGDQITGIIYLTEIRSETIGVETEM